MDLLTQGLLGGVLALSVAKKKESRRASAIGFAAALLADADILISASDDPLMNVEFHRHFSHALVFIPVGALIAALLLWPLLRKRLGFKRIYWYALLGYATSGLLDACTSYGTHLLWPFSDARIAWSIIAIIDPVFSLALLISLILGFKYCKPIPARVGLGLAGAYLLLGVWQHQNALQSAMELVEQRGHNAHRIIVKPTLANLVLWRSVYQSNDFFYVDAIRISPGPQRIYPGKSARKFNLQRDRPELGRESTISRDIARFSKLANDYVITDPGRANVLTDVRYSMLPIGITPMWGLDLNVASASQHAKFKVYRDQPDNARDLFLAMLLGHDLSN
ncbi:MAG: metal-dependent hydrolase [Gammaproteobacteria bacterium]|nr:metal-dependent hydrolase [Gammaproteobacteria bacterium]